MTEAEWLSCEDPTAMLRLIEQTEDEGLVIAMPRRPSFKVSDRKLRLFACACMERVAQYGQEPSEAGWGKWAESVEDVRGEFSSLDGARYACGKKVGQIDGPRLTREEKAHRASLLREIVGNPWRPVEIGVLVDAEVNAWEEPPWLTPDALALAQSLYECRDWSGLPALADMLEEAGCAVGLVHEFNNGGIAYWWNDAFPGERHLTPDRASIHPLLAHLHSPGPHVRGCWALDLILGKS